MKFAILDIETTGLDPFNDQIIDVGYLLFEEGKVIKKYSSLVFYDEKLSEYIKALTGINERSLKLAPKWSEVKKEIELLDGIPILAHNSAFEESFLKNILPKSDFIDSIYFFSLLTPKRPSFSLESFLVDLSIREKELHRGFDDSLDLMKVILVALKYLQKERSKKNRLIELLEKFDLKKHLFSYFLDLSNSEIDKISEELDFSLGDKSLFYDGNREIKTDEFNSINSIIEEDDKNVTDFKFNGESIKGILRDSKRMMKINPHYHYRIAQEMLALRIGQAFKHKVHALIQAPTGVGKTLGYMIPSMLMALEENKTVLIATGTKTLQNQIVSKDLPEAKRILAINGEGNKSHRQIKDARILGSNNHICELLYREQNDNDGLFTLKFTFEEKLAAIYFEMIFFHNENSPYDKMILGDDIPYVLKKRNEQIAKKDIELRVDFRTCLGDKCAYKARCSYLRGLKIAREGSLIIGNHALMLNWPKSIPRPTFIVVDEAHKLEKDALSTFSLEVSEDSLKRILEELNQGRGLGSLYYLISKELKNLNDEQIHAKYLEIKNKAEESAQKLANDLFGLRELIEKYFKLLPYYTSLHWNETAMRGRNEVKDEVALGIFNTFDNIRKNLSSFYMILNETLDLFIKEDMREESLLAYARYDTFVKFLGDKVLAINTNLEQTLGFAHSIKYHESEGFLLLSSPIDIGSSLYENLIAPSDSVVFTSATLGNIDCSVGTKGIEWMLGYSKIPNKRKFEKIYHLPPLFDYQNKAKVILSMDTPSLSDMNFVPSVLENIIPLIRSIGGRSLLLFSSKFRFDQAREVLLHDLKEEIPLFVQGMGNQVVEEYKKSKKGVLLGMESFGEGIDIPGDSLQFLYIDKIPDMRMDYVIEMRRKFFQENFGNEFQDYYMAERVRGLHQKLGRLLRRIDDFGCAIITDSRAKSWKGKTLKTLDDLLLPYIVEKCNLKDATREAERFIKNFQDYQAHLKT